MDRGAWRATVHRVTRVRHDLETAHTQGEVKIKSPLILAISKQIPREHSQASAQQRVLSTQLRA